MPADQPRSISRLAPGWFGLAALAIVIASTLSLASQPSALTRSTIHLALTEYATALWLMLGMSPEDWQIRTSRGRWTRWLWTCACLTILVHVACAFHFAHHWSHAHAFEQTRRESGFGEGLYFNYLFMAAWTADVLWWWISPSGYSRRSPWIDRLLHGFLLFIAFNATVVFERGPIQVAGVAVSLLLAMRWFRTFLRRGIVRSTAKPASDPSP